MKHSSHEHKLNQEKDNKVGHGAVSIKLKKQIMRHFIRCTQPLRVSHLWNYTYYFTSSLSREGLGTAVTKSLTPPLNSMKSFLYWPLCKMSFFWKSFPADFSSLLLILSFVEICCGTKSWMGSFFSFTTTTNCFHSFVCLTKEIRKKVVFMMTWKKEIILASKTLFSTQSRQLVNWQ